MQTLLDAIIKTASSWRNHFTSPLKSTQFIAVTMTEFVFLEKDSLHIAVQLVHSPHLLCGPVQQQLIAVQLVHSPHLLCGLVQQQPI